MAMGHGKMSLKGVVSYPIVPGLLAASVYGGVCPDLGGLLRSTVGRPFRGGARVLRVAFVVGIDMVRGLVSCLSWVYCFVLFGLAGCFAMVSGRCRFVILLPMFPFSLC